MSREEAAKIIESFIDGSGDPWDWDEFLHTTTKDEIIAGIQRQCNALPDKFPPDKPNHYCNDKGIEVLKQFIGELRKNINKNGNKKL